MKRQRGFIALMSAIIIAVVLLIIATTGGLISFYGRVDVLMAEYKNESASLADACLNQVLLELGRDGTVTAGSVAVGSESCTIVSASSPYRVQGVYQNAYTNLQFTVDAGTLEVTSLEELSTL